MTHDKVGVSHDPGSNLWLLVWRRKTTLRSELVKELDDLRQAVKIQEQRHGNGRWDFMV